MWKWRKVARCDGSLKHCHACTVAVLWVFLAALPPFPLSDILACPALHTTRCFYSTCSQRRRLRDHVKRSKSLPHAQPNVPHEAANKQMATNSKMTAPVLALVVTILSAACLSTVQASANKAAPPPSLMYRTTVTQCHNTRPHHAALTN